MNFFREILRKAKTASAAACLAPHATNDTVGRDIICLRDSFTDAILRETNKIGDEVSAQISRFPNVLRDFSLVSVWLRNLSAVAEIFYEESPTVASRANKLKDTAERSLSEHLNSMTERTHEDMEALLKLLLRLKKASNEISSWKSSINRCIDTLLVRASKGSSTGRFALEFSVQLNTVKGKNAATAQQILNDHDIFKGAMNAAFHSATARQGIKYVTHRLNAAPCHKFQLKSMYEAFLCEYRDIIEDGLLSGPGDESRRTHFLRNLAVEAGSIAADFSMSYKSQLVSLSAHLFAFWSLESVNSFSDGNGGASEASINFLRKPHAAQVVAVWTMLNYKEPGNFILKNQMCELQTGEGKSIVLGVTATILALVGCDVDCVCYSSYLSHRDYNYLRPMFQHFGVDSFISYNTIEKGCSRIFFNEIDTHKLAEKIMLNEMSQAAGSQRSQERLKILLVDEVDVFFKKDFFGKTYNPTLWYHHRTVAKLLYYYIWEKRDYSDLVQQLLSSFPADARPIVEHEIPAIVQGAHSVTSGSNLSKYYVAKDQIAYKYFDGITSSFTNGYETLFAYIKEYEKGNISKTSMQSQLTLRPYCGQFSYAEIPLSFDAILGVTGTLSGLTDPEKNILQKVYNICDLTIIPSVYGSNKLHFAGDNREGKHVLSF